MCPGGYACLANTCSGGNLNGLVLNVLTHQLTGTVLLNGLQPTSSCLSASRATVRFVEAERGYTFSYDVPCPSGGGTLGTPFSFGGAIFPGVYRVTVSGGVSDLPSQQYVISEAFPVTGDVLNQTLNVVTSQAGGTVLLNGLIPTSTCLSASRATVRFTDAAKGYTFSYDVPCPSGGGSTGTPFTWSGPIFPGTYRVTVSGGVSNLPSQQYVIAEAFPVAGNVTNQQLNVVTHQASGVVVLNGATPTSTCLSASRATVRFVDSVKGYTFSYDVPCPSGGGSLGTPFAWSGAIFPGTYRVTVSGGVSNLPGQQYVIAEAFPVNGDVLNQTLDVLTFQAGGTVVLNGSVPTSTCLSASRATVRFVDAEKGYTFSYDVPCPSGGGSTGTPFTWSGSIFPGTYRVTVSGGVSNLPSQQYVIAEAFLVGSNVTGQQLNVVTHQASGVVLLNGAVPTSSCLSASRATVRFVDSVKGYTFSYDVPCPSGGGSVGTPFAWSGAIFPGSYRVTVSGGVSNLPGQQFVIADTFPVNGDVLNQSLDVTTFSLAGTVLLNGAQPTSTCLSASRATVRFVDAVKGYTFSYDLPCPSGGGTANTPFTFSGVIFPGDYRVTVSGGVSNLPGQQYVAVTSLRVP